MQNKTVVAATRRLTKQQLHSKVMVGWSRMISRMGKGSFADMLEITTPAVDKQLGGSMPRFEQIDRAFDEDPSVLDDWIKEKGCRIVPADAVCTVDNTALVMSSLLQAILAAEHPDSPGGRTIVHTELLSMEDLIRAVHARTGAMLTQISDIRRPRAAA